MTKELLSVKEYLKAQNRTNETVTGGSVNTDELHRLSKSDFRWADNRSKQFNSLVVKKGEVYQIEFGKNYIPEMSYEHRGLVIGVKKKLLYVLPIFSYDSHKHPDVYHPTDFPNSKSDLYLLNCSEFAFINHDSVLKLNDLRTISVNRILYKQNGRIDPNSDTYKQIKKLVLKKYFLSFYRDSVTDKQTIENLKKDKTQLEEANKALTAEKDNLQKEIDTLKTKLSSE